MKEEIISSDNIGQNYLMLADYVSNLHFSVKRRIESTEWESWKRWLEYRETKLKKLESKELKVYNRNSTKFNSIIFILDKLNDAEGFKS